MGREYEQNMCDYYFDLWEPIVLPSEKANEYDRSEDLERIENGNLPF